MKTANIINQINAGVHILLETTKQNILIDLIPYAQSENGITFDALKDILDKRFDEASKAVDEDE